MDIAHRATAALAAAAALALLAAPAAVADPAEPPPGETAVVVVPEGGDAVAAGPESGLEAGAEAGSGALVPGPSSTTSVTTASVTTTGAAEALPATEGAPHYEGVPHLPSPNSLPPGTSLTPPPERKLDGLRDIWDAVQNDEITKGDALLLMITQRPRGQAPAEQMTPRPSDPIMFAPDAAAAPALDAVAAPAPEIPPTEPILPTTAP